MNFSTPDKVADLIWTMKDADKLRAPNRALIIDLFNGLPPYTEKECEENHISVNVNWKEGTMLLSRARDQYENAFLSTSNFFTVSVPDAPPSKRNKVESVITREANRILKKSRPFFHTMRSKFGGVAMFGVGAQMWSDQHSVVPFYVPIEDILLPTDTELTMESLSYFAVRRRMTPGELFRKTLGKGKNIDPGWDLKAVKAVLQSYKDLNQTSNTWNWSDHPEKMAELFKQNLMYYDSDSAPSVWFWDFYHQEDDNEKSCWYRKIILDSDCVPGKIGDANTPLNFVYDSKKPFADKLDEIIHFQFGDLNNKAPFMYHSVRSLGMMLFDTVHMSNRLRCQFMQKVFEDLMMLFRIQDPSDRSRLDRVYLGMNYGVIPEGLSFVQNQERYQVNANLVEMQLSNLRQLMGESTSAYTQDVDTGTNKERTAYEVSAQLNQVTAMTGSLLNIAYQQENFSYQEICRRLCKKGTLDFTAKKFQEKCKEMGVNEKWLDVDRWDIQAERVLGSGNTQLQEAQAGKLMSIRPMLNPESQQKVLNDFVFSVTRDARRADELAPRDAAPHVSDTQHDTEIVFGTLMAGTPVTPKPGLNPLEVIETMINLMGATVQNIMQTGGVGTPQQVNGMQMAAQYTGAFMQMLAGDDTMKQQVKQFGDALGKIMNMVKAFAQRQQQAAQAAAQKQPQLDPETQAKIAADMATTQQKLRSKDAAAQQRMLHKQQQFMADQQRQNAKTLAEIQQETMKVTAEAGLRKPAMSETP